MKGWHIFVHSVRLVMSNLEQAFRVSIVLYLVQVANQVQMFLNPLPVMTGPLGTDMPMVSPGFAVQTFLLGLISLMASLWIAVAWHRFVLKEEYPDGWLPKWHGAFMLGYLGRSILIGLAVSAGVLVVAIPVAAVTTVVPALWGMVSLILIGVGAYLFFRLAVILPAAALGEPLTLRDAWGATSGESETFVTLAALVVAASILVMLPSWVHNNTGSLINLIYGLVVNWFVTIIGISVLTTLYGHFIEKRAID